MYVRNKDQYIMQGLINTIECAPILIASTTLHMEIFHKLSSIYENFPL